MGFLDNIYTNHGLPGTSPMVIPSEPVFWDKRVVTSSSDSGATINELTYYNNATPVMKRVFTYSGSTLLSNEYIKL